MQPLTFFGLLAVGLLAVNEIAAGSAPGGQGSLGCKGPTNEPLCLELAKKWGPVFGCPVQTLMTIARIESAYRPTCVNTSVRALALGGAWGMCQMTLTTGKGHAAALASHNSPLVKATLAKWNGTGSCLLDPDLNIMFACRQLGASTKEFGDDISLVAGAYHQGAGKIRQMIADGQPIPAALPPFGKIYVTSALKWYPTVRTA